MKVFLLSHQSLGVKVEEEWGDDLIEEPQDKEKAAPIGQGVSHRRRFFNDRWILDATNSALVKRLALLRFEEHGNGLPRRGSMLMINGVLSPISLLICTSKKADLNFRKMTVYHLATFLLATH